MRLKAFTDYPLAGSRRSGGMSLPFEYEGDPAFAPRIHAALKRVIDPEMALGIVSLGLVYSVRVAADRVHVRMTMTSAACPVAEMIIADTADAIGSAMGDGRPVEVELCWEPPWDPGRMSTGARAAMGWE
jgi:metal-sulfur cluster biosynthetic enzyme